jgi:ferric-dicitrate binding protein FerR (iron transport regulator)
MSNRDLHEFQQNLIEDESFIRWVKSEFQEGDDYWSTFIDEHPKEEDDINAAIRFVLSMSFKEQSSIDKEKLWNRIAASTGHEVNNTGNVRNLKFYKLGAALLAAACLLFFFVFRFGISDTKHINTGIAQELVEKLPDGSTVRLDATTEIAYSPEKWRKERKLSLDGLAFFEVIKGEKFVVETTVGSVKVLGTSFSVNSRNNHFEVICKTGKVAVMKKNGQQDEIILTPGDKVVLSDGVLELTKAENGTPNEIMWINGMYTFDNQPLSEVIRELERQYDIEVSIANEHSSIPYTGFFRKGNLNDALYSVTWQLDLKYRMDGKMVFITK